MSIGCNLMSFYTLMQWMTIGMLIAGSRLADASSARASDQESTDAGAIDLCTQPDGECCACSIAMKAMPKVCCQNCWRCWAGLL